MARGRPLKPEKAHAVAVFPKRGGVRIERRDWPRVMDDQEMAAAEAFAEALETRTGRRLMDLRRLEQEADHDVEGKEGEQRIQIQVTELVTREYVRPLDGGGFRLDGERLNGALEERIRAKVAKRYAKETGTRLVLLAYSIDLGATEFIIRQVTGERGTRQVMPEGLRRAQEAAALDSGAFDEVWYVAPTPTGHGLLAGVLPAEEP